MVNTRSQAKAAVERRSQSVQDINAPAVSRETGGVTRAVSTSQLNAASADSPAASLVTVRPADGGLSAGHTPPSSCAGSMCSVSSVRSCSTSASLKEQWEVLRRQKEELRAVLDEIKLEKLHVRENAANRQLEMLAEEEAEIEAEIESSSLHSLKSVPKQLRSVSPSATSRHVVSARTSPSSTPVTHVAQSSPTTSPQAADGDIQRLASVLDSMHNERSSELPPFAGQPSDWLLFKMSFDEMKSLGASKFKIIKNIRKSLSGPAREAVEALLFACADPEEIVQSLENQFGRPKLIVEQQLSKLHTVKITENNTTEFARLAATVKNIVVTLSSLKLEKYLHSTDIFANVINKLTPLQKSKYIDFAASQGAAVQEPELVTVSRFLQHESAKLFKYADVVDCPSVLPATSEVNQRAKRASVKAAYVVKSCNDGSPRQGSAGCGCAAMHASMAECKQFLDKSVLERWATVIERKLCFRCLSNSHLRPRCPSATNCGQNGCSRPHHPLLHRTVDQDEEQVMNVKTTGGAALLKVLPVTITGPKGRVQVYALLDDGATVSLMDKAVADAIGVEGVTGNLNITGINSFSTVPSMDVFCAISGIARDAAEYPLRSRTVPKLSVSPQSISKEILLYEHLRGLELQSYDNVKPGLLIGQDNVGLLLPSDFVQGREGEPVATRTLLGWVLHGYHSGVTSAGFGCSHFIGHVASTANDELNELVRKSFALDALGVSQTPRVSPADQRAISIVDKTACQNEEGRWEAGLPWKSDVFVMPDNRHEALRRLCYVQRRGEKDPKFMASYAAQIENLLEQGYAEECPDAGIPGKRWYLPHFPVVNPNKPGKVRLVFDAASKTGGLSLNDMLLTGPNLLVSLLGVLFRFRQGPVAVTADIKEMFLRFLVRQNDRDYLRFLWPKVKCDESGESQSGHEVIEYRMRSIIFGAASSPFMAIHLKNKNAECIKYKHPLAYKTIVEHYMDDLVNSFETISEASEVIAKVTETHRRGGMELRAWASNAPEVIAQFPSELHATGPVALGDDGDKEAASHKILGVMWHPEEDTLRFNTAMPRLDVTVLKGESRPTKRQLLVAIASMYDPLGLVSPYTIFGKILLQDVWRAGTGWDERLSDEQSHRFQEWISRLSHYGQVSIPRCYALGGFASILELHTFCDASELAYSAACYWRIVSSHRIHCTLVVAKARVAPLRPVSIPRMELQAAVLGARLANTVVSEHDIKPVRQVFWSDSGTVLAWIRSDARRYKAYVANRLGEIDELTGSGQWRWVPTAQNPADLATRDKSVVVEGDSEWFVGPSFLYGDESAWPHLPPGPMALPCEEIKEQILTTTCDDSRSLPLPSVDRISNWAVLINATANVLLFIQRLREHEAKMSITIKQRAERLWVQQVQKDCYSAEYACLRAGRPIPSNSSLLEATPYLDEHGLMRVRGRIDAASSAIPLSFKRPIILGKHPYTDLLLAYYHKKYLHGSTETVLNEVRQMYWIPRLRSRLRYVSHRCVMCRIRKARPLSPPVGNLPLERLDFAKRPFTHCGVDYFGPINVTIGRRKEKRWVCLFTCLVCRAVHLEIADSLTSDSALLALRRFMARRGPPATVFSDNGTNFRAADKELRAAWAELDKAELERQALSYNIVWKFIPAAAPHMGGAWERLVQAVKRALFATVKERAPKPEVLHTLLAEAEAMVNSRPLSRVSTDPKDEEALTPNHFLLGSSTGRLTTPGVFDESDLCSRRDWRVTQRLADHFWARWTKECLPLLRVREKNTNRAVTDLIEGEVVVIADERLPRNCWPLGRVAAVYPGRDGRVRVVDVRTAQGTYRRPAKMVAPLRLDN